jgi:hypothetical protein
MLPSLTIATLARLASASRNGVALGKERSKPSAHVFLMRAHRSTHEHEMESWKLINTPAE